MKLRFELLEVSKLKSHEEIRPELLDSLVREIQADGYLRKPVLVEDRHYVILDGHHRYEALKKLGCRKIPVYLVDYFDDAIYLTTWPGAKHTHVTKDDVLKMAGSGGLYPPKTTRHIVNIELREVKVKLTELM
jgi:hypothetical protein